MVFSSHACASTHRRKKNHKNIMLNSRKPPAAIAKAIACKHPPFLQYLQRHPTHRTQYVEKYLLLSLRCTSLFLQWYFYASFFFEGKKKKRSKLLCFLIIFLTKAKKIIKKPNNILDNPIIRQNNDLFRQTKKEKWFISGVVFKVVFGYNKKRIYYCKTTMQILTAQYPTMYTRKYRVFFTDIQPNINERGDIKLFTLAKGYQIISIAMKSEIPFNGAGITSSEANVFIDNNMPPTPSILGSLASYNTFNASSDKNGTIQSINKIKAVNAPLDNDNWCNFLTPTGIYASMLVNAGANINQLTSGQLLIWVTTMRVS